MKAHKDLTLSCGCRIKEGESLVFFFDEGKTICPKHTLIYLVKKIHQIKDFYKEVKKHVI